jgi:hypothetical protein
VLLTISEEATVSVDEEVLGRLVGSAVAPPCGRFRASAVITTVEGPPPSEIPRRFSPFREDGPRRTGTVEAGCVLTVLGDDRWSVERDDGGMYRRNGDRLSVRYPGQENTDLDLEDARTPTGGWAYWAEHWVEELVLPHRLVGLLDEVELAAPGTSRWRGRPSLRQPDAYSGIARDEVLVVEFTADLERGVITEATATAWNHHVDRYILQPLDS